MTELEALLADAPELEAEFETLLELDAEGPWEFDDIPLDSGTFGEIVSRGIVEKVDGQYRLADPAAVRTVLEGESSPVDGSGTGEQIVSMPKLPEFDGQALRPLGVGLLILFLARIYMYPQVFRPEAITFLGNDPYFYRYWILELARAEAGLFAVPDGIQIGEPFLVSTLWTLTSIFGGAAETGFVILAWYPVGAALLSGSLLYLLAVTLTRDRRVGLATLVIIAVTPVLGYRMALGFGDHHAFDSLWLALTMTAIAWMLGRDDHSLAGIAIGIVGIAVGVSAQVLAWEAGALLLVPIALYGPLHGYVTVQNGHSALRELGPITLGVALGAAVSWLVHLQWGWQTQNMILPPSLLAGGLVGVIVIAEGGRKLDLSAPLVGVGVLGMGFLAIVSTAVFLPEFTAEALAEIAEITGQDGIAENVSVFSRDLGLIAGPFFFFGVSLYFGLPYMLWGFWHAFKRNEPAWLMASSYAVVFFLLGILRSRFAGQLALIAAVFSGIAFIHLFAVVTDRDRPAVLNGSVPDSIVSIPWSRPDRTTVFALVGVFILVGGLGAMMTPLRVNLLTYSDDQYDAAMYMEGHAAEQNLEYPQSYVFSEWGEARMYNALVSGESKSYGFARANYEDFIVSTNGSVWYERLKDRGYIVTTDLRETSGLEEEALYRQLHEGYGAETAHYRVLYSAADGSVKVFEPVPGATIAGTAGSNQTVSISGEMELADSSEAIERTVQADASGEFRIAVATPGTYRIDSHTVTVNESVIQSGGTVTLD